MADAVTVRLSVQGEEEVTRAFKRMGDQSEQLFTSMRFSANLMAGALTGIFGALTLDSVVKQFKEVNAELIRMDEQAKRTKMSLNEIAGLNRVGADAGVTGAQIDTGLRGLTAKMQELRDGEGDLAKLLDDNNVKYRDREGKLLASNELLRVAADLLNRASTEQDKIDIARLFGLTEEWVRILENGPRAFQASIEKANELGAVLDEATVRRAREFDAAWNAAWAAFGVNAKSMIFEVMKSLGDAIDMATRLLRIIPDARRAMSNEPSALNGPVNDTSGGNFSQDPNFQGQGFLGGRTAPVPSDRPPASQILGNTVLNRGNRGGGRAPSGGGTQVSQIKNYIEGLERANELLEAEARVIGKSAAEREKALAIVRAEQAAKQEGRSLTQEEIANTSRLAEEKARLTEQIRQQEQAQKAVNDATMFFGQAAVSGLSDIVSGGKNAERAMMNLTKRLADASLQALLLGQGPLAGMFGTSPGTAGGVGGLFGLGLSAFRGGGAGGGLFGGLFGGGASSSLNPFSFNGGLFANGAAFHGGHVVPFATGGVVSGPSYFPMAGGRTGLMGEAGPEGILPLDRTSDGRLGVRATGAGSAGTVVNVVNNTGQPVREERRQDNGREMVTIIIGEVRRDIASGGMDGVLAARFGASRSVARR
jgi:hypothetical protein